MQQADKDLIGKIEFYNESIVKGWALNKSLPDTPLLITVLENGRKADELTPSIFRWELKDRGYGRGYHGFIYRIPSALLDGKSRELKFVFDQSGQELPGSPVHVNHVPEKDHTPLETTSLTGTKVLVIAPHADDESLGCGGGIVRHTANGDPVKVVFLTDGAEGDYSGKYSKEEYITIRESEAKEACSILGVEDIVFWSEPARNLSVSEENIEKLSGLLNEYEPELIYAPSPFEFHPDHRASAEILWRAIQKSGLPSVK